jgi:hypothetical protein
MKMVNTIASHVVDITLNPWTSKALLQPWRGCCTTEAEEEVTWEG